MTISKAIDPARVGLSMDQSRAAWDKLADRSEYQGECLVWTGARNDRGYGQVVFEGRVWYAHRLSWELTFGPIADGLFVCHHCDNPPCWRAGHLFLGTNADNQRDASRKGRKPTGDNHVGHRLSADQVLAIRTSSGNQRQVAERFGVSQSLVSRIRSGDRRVTA